MIKRSLLLSLALVAPAAFLALDFSDATERYADAPFTVPEAAGISVLTSLGAVEGNPDGTFAPDRTLNRAEYLKIVLASAPKIRVSTSDAAPCFPDVASSDWFSPYVCIAKVRGMVQGYPDGLFRPENAVNYAEALKMLGELYDVQADVPAGSAWFLTYSEAAYAAGVGLPGMQPQMAHLLTRGEMARLAAAYRAYDEGELEAYRDAEKGIVRSSVSSMSSSPSSEASSQHGTGSSLSSSASGSSVSSAVSSSASSAQAMHPTGSHFLLLGAPSELIATGAFQPRNANADVRLVTVKMVNEIKSFEELYLVDAQGRKIASLALDIYDQDDKTWKAELSVDGSARLLQGQDTVFGIAAKIKERGAGSFAEELVQMDRFILTLQEQGGASYETFPDVQVFPKHQTAQALVTGVENALDAEGVLQEGQGKAVASFRFTGEALESVPLRIEHLMFTVEKTGGATADRWYVGAENTLDRHSCSIPSGSTSGVNCLSIPDALGDVSDGELILTLYADVSILSGSQGGSLQVRLEESGDTETFGAVRWTDGVGHYRWVDLEEPVAEGTLWVK